MNQPYGQASDYLTLTTAHQEALVISGLIWHFQMRSFVPKKGENNPLEPYKDVMSYLSNTAYNLEVTIKTHRVRYLEEMKRSVFYHPAHLFLLFYILCSSKAKTPDLREAPR